MNRGKTGTAAKTLQHLFSGLHLTGTAGTGYRSCGAKRRRKNHRLQSPHGADPSRWRFDTVTGKAARADSSGGPAAIGVAWSDSGFSGYLTVENIIPILEQLYSRFDKPFFVEQLQKWELPIHKRIKEFSTGMKAKLKTLIAISHHAKLLILDEPTAGLDVVARDELLDLLRDYMQQDDSRSILISSHISSDLESICDDIYMIDQGRIVLHEDTDVLLGDYVFLKMNPEQYEQVDKQYLLRCQKESYGYCCLTNQRQFYQENYPALVIEKSSIDKVITMMIRGER